MSESFPCASLILDSIGEAVFTVDLDFRITSFNRAAEQMTGWTREDAIGMKCRDVFHADICQNHCPLAKTFESQKPLEEIRATILDIDMDTHWVHLSTALLRDESGTVIGGVEVMRDMSDWEQLRRDMASHYVFEDIVGQSKAMREIFGILPDLARTSVPIVIQGPSGTGKEMIAQAIHRLSPRAQRPMVRINCAALPDTLLESELFGHEKGAFTDAKHRHPGHFVQAHGGTLFLDEIGETSPAFQVKLLRVLEEGEIRPLGATHSIPVDVRIIAATNRDLQREIQAGRFREDLYYRLAVWVLKVPPLTERREDIPLLVHHLLKILSLRHDVPMPRISPEFIQVLMNYDFPGNVRELRNLLERSLILCHEGVLRPKHLPDLKKAWQSPPLVSKIPMKGVSRDLVIQTLQKYGGHRGKTARELGISRTTLWRKMKAWGFI